MADTHTVTCLERMVMEDGRIRLTEETQSFIDGVFSSGRKDHRFIELGDDVSAEDPLIQDIANGILATPERIAAREAVLNPPPEVEEEAV